MSAGLVTTLELEGYDLAASAVQNYYFTDARKFVTRGGDTPAHTAFKPRLKQPLWATTRLFGRGTTRGRSRLEWGEAVLANVDGGLNGLRNVAFAGRPAKQYLGESGPTYPSGYTQILRGVTQQIESARDDLILRIADRSAELDKPLQTNLYGGTNSLPNGLDGTPDDLKGQPKPWLSGTVKNFAAPCVNTPRWIFQLHDGAIYDAPGCYANGAALTRGTDYTSQSDMETNAPAAGYYRVWPAGGYARINNANTGDQITFDVIVESSAASRTTAQVMKQILLKAGVASGDISSSDVTALDSANSAEIGGVFHGLSIAQALDVAAEGGHAWWAPDPSGLYRLGRLEDPSGGTAVAALTDVEILRMERIPTNDPGQGVPAWRATGNHTRNATVQSQVAGSVSVARREWLAREYRSVKAEDTSVLTKWPGAVEIVFNSLFVSESATQTEATRQVGLYGVPRDFYLAIARVTASMAAAIRAGVVISIVYPAEGIAAVKKFVVLAHTHDRARNELTLEVWG